MMPNMDGWDTIREIVARGYTERVMVVMLTAKDTPDEKMDGLQEFVFDYITKPFYPDELIERVMKYLTYI
ncbi:MAG: response regulator [Methanomicrobiales archaeon]|nr:response regulator [Methanomicrobiales archaeon]